MSNTSKKQEQHKRFTRIICLAIAVVMVVSVLAAALLSQY